MEQEPCKSSGKQTFGSKTLVKPVNTKETNQKQSKTTKHWKTKQIMIFTFGAGGRSFRGGGDARAGRFQNQFVVVILFVVPMFFGFVSFHMCYKLFAPRCWFSEGFTRTLLPNVGLP